MLGICLPYPAPPAICQTAGPTDDATAPYYDATNLIVRGRRYGYAIDLLSGLVRDHPEKATYHAALGNAYLSRAASVAFAWHNIPRYEQDLNTYKRLSEEWQKAQQDPASPQRGKAAPVKPVLRAPGESQEFTLTSEQAQAECIRLALAALKEYDAAVAAAPEGKERDEHRYARAWGRLLLSRLVNEYGLSWKEQPALTVTIGEFKVLAEAHPEEGMYWQALGDAYLGGQSIGLRNEEVKAAAEAYEKALEAEPKNAALAFRLSSLYTSTQAGVRDNARSVAVLRNAVVRGGQIAFLWYRLAYRLTEGNPDSKSMTEAVSCLRQGNNAPVYVLPVYSFPVPRLLKSAWSYSTQAGVDRLIGSMEFTRLPQRVGDYAKTQARTNPDEATSIATEVVRMGLRLADAAPKPEQQMVDAEGKLLFRWGNMTALQGQALLVNLYQERGEKKKAQQARQTFQALQAALQKRSDALAAAYSDSYHHY